MPTPYRNATTAPADYTLLSVGVIVVGLGVGAYLLWTFQHGAVSSAMMQLSHWQMRFIDLFTDRYELADHQLLKADPERVTFAQLSGLCRDIGRFSSIPAALFVFGLGAACFLRAGPARFCRPLDLEALIREQSRTFRGITAFRHRRLRLSPIGAPAPRPCDPALNLREWVACRATNRDDGFDETKARAELIRQLGPLWRGPEQAAAPARLMFAVFALHRAGRRQDAIKLLGDLAQALAPVAGEAGLGPEEPLAIPASILARADYWIAHNEAGPPARKLTARHAFTATTLMTLLVEARLASGMLAPVQFAALKLVDRRLWYALHSLGFPADGPGEQIHPNPRVEAIGVRDHWATECAAGEPIVLPSIDRALAAIRAGLATSQSQSEDKP